jgi:hypothetical protein
MKKLTFIVLILFMSLFMARHSYTQCIPDTIGCVDINEPGQICPDTLPDGYVGVYYEETVTVWPPPEAIVGESAVTIYKIIIDSIGNIPPGIDYEINAVDLYPDTAYCVLVTGTPTTPGTYTLYIRVIPFIKVFQNIVELDPQVDDTSITANVKELSQLPELRNNSFAVIGFSPNPFAEHSKIGFYNISAQTVTLEIYSILGEIIYTEKLYTAAGENYFDFDGRYLKGGIYMYKISTSVRSYLGKFTKIK